MWGRHTRWALKNPAVPGTENARRKHIKPSMSCGFPCRGHTQRAPSSLHALGCHTCRRGAQSVPGIHRAPKVVPYSPGHRGRTNGALKIITPCNTTPPGSNLYRKVPDDPSTHGFTTNHKRCKETESEGMEKDISRQWTRKKSGGSCPNFRQDRFQSN